MTETGKPYDGNYDNFVSLSREIMRGRNTVQQRETVAAVLGSLLPPEAPATFRKIFPFNRATAEFNAWLTTIFFACMCCVCVVHVLYVMCRCCMCCTCIADTKHYM